MWSYHWVVCADSYGNPLWPYNWVVWTDTVGLPTVIIQLGSMTPDSIGSYTMSVYNWVVWPPIQLGVYYDEHTIG